MRVLYLTSAGCCDLEDACYAAIVEVLGRANVVDYPYKPSLHCPSLAPESQSYLRDNPRDLYGYHPSKDVCHLASYDGIFRPSWRGLESMDAIIIGSPRPDPVFAVQQIVKMQTWQRAMPIVLLDGEEHDRNSWEMLNEFGLGGVPIAAIVKQFAPVGHNWNVHVLPCPANLWLYSLYTSFTSPGARATRYSPSIFFAGDASSPLRLACLEGIRSAGLPLNGWIGEKLRYGEYLNRVRHSQISLNFGGAVFSTRRYWEIPAVGGFMLTEQPTVDQGPNDFEPGGRHVAWFTDPSSCIEQCRYWLQHPQSCAGAGARAQEHVACYHSLQARGSRLVEILLGVLSHQRPVR